MVSKKYNFSTRALILFVIITIVIICSNILRTIGPIAYKYTTFDYWERFSQLEKAFQTSQYVDKNPKGWIPDEAAFTYAAGKYIQGINPVYVVPDAPPLGKYMIGLSIILFSNEHIIVLLFGLLSLILLYILGKQIFSNKILALLPVVLLSFEPLFLNQFYYTPLLDTMQLSYLLLIFILFNRTLYIKKYVIYYLLIAVVLGMYIATKFFVTGFVIAAALLLVLTLRKYWKRSLYMLASFPLSILILISSYSRVFAYGYSLREIFGIQKWIFLYHQSKLISPFSVWFLLLFNQWYVWWGDKKIIHDDQWLITWPIITIVSFVTITLYILKKINHTREIEICMAWVVLYLLLFSFGNITSRYFIILLPVLYLISIYGLKELFVYCYEKYYTYNKKKSSR